MNVKILYNGTIIATLNKGETKIIKCADKRMRTDLEIEIIKEIPSGLFDENDVMLASWDELVNDYGLDVEMDYSVSSSNENYFKTSASSMYYILNNNDKFSNAKKLVLGNNISIIGICAISDCTSLKNIIIQNGVTDIKMDAFDGCTSLESITIPKSLKRVGHASFGGCSKLTNVYYCGTIEDWCDITFGSSLMVGRGSFYMLDSNNNWYEVTEIEIPSTITKIGSYQFYGFINVTSITIPNSVTSIGMHAFFDCTLLKNVFLPTRLKSIDEDAFFINNVTVHFPNTMNNVIYPFYGGTASQTIASTSTYNGYFNYSENDEVLFDTTKLLGKGSSKKTMTYNIYTDNTTLKNACLTYKDSYTIVNMYHLDRSEWGA